MTFDPKDKTHKAQLYTALVAAAELEGAYFDDFLQIPFETPWNLATGYRRNLQRGDYSAIRAQILYDWMMDRYFTTAHAFAPDIFPFTPEMRLQQIVDDHAITGKLRLVLPRTHVDPHAQGINARRAKTTKSWLSSRAPGPRKRRCPKEKGGPEPASLSARKQTFTFASGPSVATLKEGTGCAPDVEL